MPIKFQSATVNAKGLRSIGKLLPGLVVLTIFSGAGYWAVSRSHAETLVTSVEAENGSLSGNQSTVADVTASNGSTVKFGSSTVNDTLTTPTALKAFTGGNSIALRWDGSAPANAGIKQYNIFRDNTQIATVTPGLHTEFPEKDGNGYVDSAVTNGQTYSYQVQAIGNSGFTSAKSASLSVAQPSSPTAVPSVNVDTSAAPDMAAWVTSTVTPFIKTWYPKIAATLASSDYTPPSTIAVVVDDTQAATPSTVVSGKINLSAAYYRAHMQETVPMAFSLTYVIDNYSSVDAHAGSYNSGSTNMPENMPAWLLNGQLRWPRDFMIRGNAATLPTANGTYFQGSPGSAYFLDWIQKTYSPQFLQKMTKALHSSTFNHSMIQSLTGKTADKLWSEMTGRTVGSLGQITSNINGFCMDISNTSSAAGTAVQIYSICHGGKGQGWTPYYGADGQNFALVSELKTCLDVAASGTADGTKVQSNGCSGSATQVWHSNSDGSITNVNSGKCLQPTGGSGNSFTQLELAACNSSTPQKWTMPKALITPLGLRAVTGGSSIAITWDVQTDNPDVKHYNVYRNGTKIGSTAPYPYIGSWQFGTQYIDSNVTKGQAYTYQVQAVDNNGAVSAMSASISATHPTTTSLTPGISLDPSIAQVTPDLVGWFNNVGIPLIQTWYPKVADLHVRPDYAPRSQIIIKTKDQATYDKESPGTAAYASFSSGDIFINPEQFRDYVAYTSGTIVHESVHTLQAVAGSTTAGWLFEGHARYVENYVVNNFPNPTNTPVTINKDKDFYATDRYGSASFMLDYITKHYDASYIHKITVQGHNDTLDYRAMQFSDGRNIDQVWALASGTPARTAASTGVASNKCIDDTDGSLANGSRIRLWPCNGATAQKLTVHPDAGLTTAHLLMVGKCLEVNRGLTANGTVVWLNDCVGGVYKDTTGQQSWTVRSDGSIVSSVAPNKCLEPYNGSSADGTTLQIWDCNGGAWQKWRTP